MIEQPDPIVTCDLCGEIIETRGNHAQYKIKEKRYKRYKKIDTHAYCAEIFVKAVKEREGGSDE